jgi:hypothetical protein
MSKFRIISRRHTSESYFHYPKGGMRIVYNHATADINSNYRYYSYTTDIEELEHHVLRIMNDGAEIVKIE